MTDLEQVIALAKVVELHSEEITHILDVVERDGSTEEFFEEDVIFLKKLENFNFKNLFKLVVKAFVKANNLDDDKNFADFLILHEVLDKVDGNVNEELFAYNGLMDVYEFFLHTEYSDMVEEWLNELLTYV